MIFFRLLDKSNNPSEYYINDLKAQYLSDIKELNVIVGANNTRKSRFIRQMINTELKVLICAFYFGAAAPYPGIGVNLC